MCGRQVQIEFFVHIQYPYKIHIPNLTKTPLKSNHSVSIFNSKKAYIGIQIPNLTKTPLKSYHWYPFFNSKKANTKSKYRTTSFGIHIRDIYSVSSIQNSVFHIPNTSYRISSRIQKHKNPSSVEQFCILSNQFLFIKKKDPLKQDPEYAC